MGVSNPEVYRGLIQQQISGAYYTIRISKKTGWGSHPATNQNVNNPKNWGSIHPNITSSNLQKNWVGVSPSNKSKRQISLGVESPKYRKFKSAKNGVGVSSSNKLGKKNLLFWEDHFNILVSAMKNNSTFLNSDHLVTIW